MNSGDDGDKFVSRLAEQISTDSGIPAIHSPSRNHVETFIKLSEKFGDIRRVVLKISIHRNQNFTARKLNARHQRRGLAGIPPKVNKPKAGHSQAPKRIRSFVRASVVHDNDLVIKAEGVESFTESRQQHS